MNITAGTELNNGATVITSTSDQMLAVRKGTFQPYVIWSYYKENGAIVTHGGDYFGSFNEALKEYDKIAPLMNS